MKILLSVSGLLLTALGITMVLMNPSQADYETFGEEQLSTYLKDEVCDQINKHITTSFGLEQFLVEQCLTMVDVSKPGFRQLIQENTKRYDYGLFSIYTTDLALPSNLPDYHFGTVGVFKQFFIYESVADKPDSDSN